MADCASCGEWITDTALICRREADREAGRLRQTADLWPDLMDQVARLTRSGDATPRAGRPAPAEPIRADSGERRHYGDQVPGWPSGIPVDLAASETADAVANTVTTWTRVIAEQRWPTGRPERPAGPWCAHDCGHGSCAALWEAARAQAAHDREMPPPATMPALLRWLAGRLEWLRYRPEAAEALDELGEVPALVWRALSRRELRARIVVGPCPELDTAGSPCAGEVVAIVPERSDRPAVMRCGMCGVEWGTAQWARAGRRIMDRMREAA